MKIFNLSIITLVFIVSIAMAQQNRVLKEGYHMPGVMYNQPLNSQAAVNLNENSKIKREYMSEAASLKRNYDTCMAEHDRMPTPKDPFDFSKSLKHKECKRYYDSYMDLTSRIIQLEQSGY